MFDLVVRLSEVVLWASCGSPTASPRTGPCVTRTYWSTFSFLFSSFSIFSHFDNFFFLFQFYYFFDLVLFMILHMYFSMVFTNNLIFFVKMWNVLTGKSKFSWAIDQEVVRSSTQTEKTTSKLRTEEKQRCTSADCANRARHAEARRDAAQKGAGLGPTTNQKRIGSHKRMPETLQFPQLKGLRVRKHSCRLDRLTYVQQMLFWCGFHACPLGLTTSRRQSAPIKHQIRSSWKFVGIEFSCAHCASQKT